MNALGQEIRALLCLIFGHHFGGIYHQTQPKYDVMKWDGKTP